MCPQPDVE